MNITQRFFITLLFTLHCITYAFAQEYSVSLSGTFQLDPASGGGLYDAFVFDGAGKVSIHPFGKMKHDFFQIGDTIVVYPDKSIFIFIKKDDQTLEGINTWIKNQIFRKIENDTVIKPMQIRNPDYAVQFYEFYTLTGRDALELSDYININMDSSLNTSMKKLCDEGFPKACITMANALMLNSRELTSYFLNSDKEIKKMKPNKEIFDYYIKAINLNELDAIAQLGAYVLLLGHKEKAVEIFEKGCELGHSGCCISLWELEMDSEEEDGKE